MKTTDFIVLGSGVAGLRAALTLAPYGHVALITKKRLSDAATNYAQGGIAAVTSDSDSVKSHIADTIRAGAGHNNKKAVSVLVSGGKQAISDLEGYGVVFDEETSFEAAHSFPRVHHATDFTGHTIEHVLLDTIKKNKNIHVFEYTQALDFIVSDKTCYGVLVLQKKHIYPIFSRVVVCATGGVGQLYQWTTDPVVITGDGIAMAHRAKAALSDMEFIQFHPTALKEHSSPLFLLSEALRGEGAYLIKSKVKSEKSKVAGTRFMKEIDARGEMAPRDIVARAIFAEQQKGYEVCLDIRHKDPSFVKKRFSNIYTALIKRGYDLTTDCVPVTPAAHFLCGGIKTDLYGRTSIRNLFAFGEVAATGVHGANRLASNSLLEGMVFARRIKSVLSDIPRKPHVQVVSLPQYTNASVSISREDIQAILWEHVGIVRTKKGLQKAETQLEDLQKQLDAITGTNQQLHELRNMIQAGRLIIQYAKRRTKSLGAHYIIK